eukprot:TRINITY_DN135779_c1_g1_i1.p1 TRINITY_DN135779_c1_g1~~TRINITY_DN135779_c1_g1_i1.p1  ORF type:complete len:227 (-),score=24.99 TRINITY_DN135779_c1_g1_i1:44-724(-)
MPLRIIQARPKIIHNKNLIKWQVSQKCMKTPCRFPNTTTSVAVSFIFFPCKIDLSPEEYEKKLRQSTTLYVGNLAFYTRDFQLLALFGKCGKVRSLIMGVNKKKKVPCGFCFVEYNSREDAARAIEIFNRTNVDGRLIRVDWDIGFSEGRQYGRGRSGGQVRDEVRKEVDKDRVTPGVEVIEAKKRRYHEDEKEEKGYRRGKYEYEEDKQRMKKFYLISNEMMLEV